MPRRLGRGVRASGKKGDMTDGTKDTKARRRRKAHWRTQMCGPGRSIPKRIRVRGTFVKVRRKASPNYELPL